MCCSTRVYSWSYSRSVYLGIFASKIKMSSTTETRNSMKVFFTTIGLNDEEINEIFNGVESDSSDVDNE